jgi:hypothetical protein
MASGQRGDPVGRAAAGGEASIDASVMEKVLEETLRAVDSDPPLDASEINSLAQIGRRYGGQPLSVEPMVVELVESILQQRFGQQIRSSAQWSDMPREIAQTLWDSPEAHQRLERLWGRLAGVAR